MAGIGDPGDEHAVRMVDEVLSRERVDELAIAAVVCGRDGHELAVACGRREPFGPDEEPVRVWREQRRSDEDQRVVARTGLLDDRGDHRVVARDEASEQLVHARDDRGPR